MKAEHRKQLETNTLADTLGKIIQSVKHGFNRNAWIVVGVIVAGFVLFLIWREFSARSQRSNASLWYKWDQLDDPDDIDKTVEALTSEDKELVRIVPGQMREKVELQRLETFAKQNAGTIQGRIARFQTARLELVEGLRDLGKVDARDRDRALKRLAGAAENYEELTRDARDLPVFHQEALLNCGKANESLGKLDEAKKYYKLLQTTYPRSEMGKVGEREWNRLENDANTAAALAKDLSALSPPPLPIRKD